MTDQLLTVAEVSYAIQESPATVRRWIYEGVLPVEHVGPYRRVRVRLSVLASFYPPDLLRIPTQHSAA
jgi:hypothetical protein